MNIDASEQIEKFQDFIEQNYEKDLHERLNKGTNFIVFDFCVSRNWFMVNK